VCGADLFFPFLGGFASQKPGIVTRGDDRVMAHREPDPFRVHLPSLGGALGRNPCPLCPPFSRLCTLRRMERMGLVESRGGPTICDRRPLRVAA